MTAQMISTLSFIADVFYKYVIVSSLLTACDYLKFIANNPGPARMERATEDIAKRMETIEQWFAAEKRERMEALNGRIVNLCQQV